MRIAQYQLVTAVLVPAFAALAPAPAVHAADGLTGVSSIRALADDRTLGASQESKISRFAEEAAQALSAQNPSEDHLEAVRADLMNPLSGGCTPAFARPARSSGWPRSASSRGPSRGTRSSWNGFSSSANVRRVAAAPSAGAKAETGAGGNPRAPCAGPCTRTGSRCCATGCCATATSG